MILNLWNEKNNICLRGVGSTRVRCILNDSPVVSHPIDPNVMKFIFLVKVRRTFWW